jgi:hypothetical protein
MGFLDSSTITVDAVLTKQGRELIKNGERLDISHFTVSDTGVDYRLWNPGHPSGSAYYGEAIENLPMLEAGVHAQYALNNRLVSYPQGTISVPALDISLPNATGTTLTFTDADAGRSTPVTATLKGFSPGGGNGGNLLYAITDTPEVFQIQSPAVMVDELTGISQTYIAEAGLTQAHVYSISPSNLDNTMFVIQLAPDQTQRVAGRQGNLTLIHGTTGAYGSITVVNNITRFHRNLLRSSQG